MAGLTPQVFLAGLGLAILLPVIPFPLEMLAPRRLTTTAFGTLTSLEPALPLIIGLVVRGQTPGLLPVAGIAFVIARGSVQSEPAPASRRPLSCRRPAGSPRVAATWPLGSPSMPASSGGASTRTAP